MRSVHVLPLFLLLVTTSSPATAQPLPPGLVESSRQLLADLVAIDTSETTGSTTPAANRIADFLKKAGFPSDDVRVLGSDDRHGNVVARLRGKGTARPVLFLAHLDVVPASKEDWTTNPYQLVEQAGYLYGRGTIDDKQFCAIFAAAFAQLKRENFVPAGDLILALTAGEETGTDPARNGVMWLLANHPSLIDAAYVINGDAGGGGIDTDGRYLAFGVQAGEKLYADFTLETTHEGGHSSRPVKDNPVYRLSAALGRVERMTLPLRVTDVSRPLLSLLATTEKGAKAADLQKASAVPPDMAAVARLAETDPSLNAQLRTTCVATQVWAGHAPNALPQRARANVNCRILPGDTVEMVLAALVKAVDDPAIAVMHSAGLATPATVHLDPAVMEHLSHAAAVVWPGVPTIPVLEVGGTDGFFFRLKGIDVYGVNHFQRDEDARAHGKDERIGIKQFAEAAHFSYSLMQLVSR